MENEQDKDTLKTEPEGALSVDGMNEPIISYKTEEDVLSDLQKELIHKNELDEERLRENIILNNFETLRHINRVREILFCFVEQIEQRAKLHDASKFESPEVEIYARNFHKLKDLLYGSDEYKANKEAIKEALDNHYNKNRHHPQHWPHGINDMTLIDLLEMLADWIGSTERNKNGNIRASLEHNADEYKMTKQLRQIFENTIREIMPTIQETSS